VEPKALTGLLDAVRRDDHCLASEEHELGVHAVAVPLRNMSGATVAALNAVVSTQRLRSGSVHSELLPLLQDAARELRPVL
jgi:IclR family pca regulon transcriptional regulator